MAKPELRAGPVMVVVVALAMIALWPSVESLWDIWRSIQNYQHGPLVAAVAIGWLALIAWRHRNARVEPSLAGTATLAALLFAWLVAYSANSQMVYQLLLPLTVWAAVWSTTGWNNARRAALPIAFLYFAIPVWDYAVPVLQRLSVAATESLLGWIGVQAEVSEYSVRIAGGTFEIIEGCSGKRYFMVTLALAVLAASMNRLRGWRAMGYLATCALLAMIANWIRIAIVIYAGDTYGMQTYLVAVEHLTLGHVIFGLLLVTALLLARWLTHRHPATGQVPEAVESHSAAAGSAWRLVPPAVLLAITFAMTLAQAGARTPGSPPGPLPLATGVWQGPLPGAPAWVPRYVGADGERRAAYVSSTGRVEVYVNTYGEQHQGEELIQYSNTLLAPGTWRRAWPHKTYRLAAQPPLVAFEARGADGSLWLLAYVFDVGGRRTTVDGLAQVYYGLQSLHNPAPSGIVALAVRCGADCSAAQELAGAFWDDMSGRILGMMPTAGTDR
jgi:EpsI family protein